MSNCRKTGKSFLHNFKLYLGGLGVSRGMAWTIRSHSLELWRDLVLHGMGEVDFHDFWKYWKVTSSPNTFKLVLGVAHTVFCGCGAHDIFWEWRTRYLSGVAHTIFVGSGAHDIFCWAPWGPGPQQHIFFTGFHYLCNCTHLLASTHSLCPDTTHQRRGSLLET